MYPTIKALKALSDETRLRMLNLLIQRECCVCEVMQAMEISQTRASRNLSILYDAGFLKLRKEGLWSYYALYKENLTEPLVRLVEAVESALAHNETVLADRERLKKVIRAGSNCASPK